MRRAVLLAAVMVALAAATMANDGEGEAITLTVTALSALLPIRVDAENRTVRRLASKLSV